VAAAGQQGTTVVLTAPTVVVGGGLPSFGYDPVHTNCPHCHADVITDIDYKVGGLAWLICGIIVFVGLFFWYARFSCNVTQLVLQGIQWAWLSGHRSMIFQFVSERQGDE